MGEGLEQIQRGGAVGEQSGPHGGGAVGSGAVRAVQGARGCVPRTEPGKARPGEGNLAGGELEDLVMDFYVLEGASGNWGQRAGVREWSLGEELNRSWARRWGHGDVADQAGPVGALSHSNPA